MARALACHVRGRGFKSRHSRTLTRKREMSIEFVFSVALCLLLIVLTAWAWIDGALSGAGDWGIILVFLSIGIGGVVMNWPTS